MGKPKRKTSRLQNRGRGRGKTSVRRNVARTAAKKKSRTKTRTKTKTRNRNRNGVKTRTKQMKGGGKKDEDEDKCKISEESIFEKGHSLKKALLALSAGGWLVYCNGNAHEYILGRIQEVQVFKLILQKENKKETYTITKYIITRDGRPHDQFVLVKGDLRSKKNPNMMTGATSTDENEKPKKYANVSKFIQRILKEKKIPGFDCKKQVKNKVIQDWVSIGTDIAIKAQNARTAAGPPKQQPKINKTMQSNKSPSNEGLTGLSRNDANGDVVRPTYEPVNNTAHVGAADAGLLYDANGDVVQPAYEPVDNTARIGATNAGLLYDANGDVVQPAYEPVDSTTRVGAADAGLLYDANGDVVQPMNEPIDGTARVGKRCEYYKKTTTGSNDPKNQCKLNSMTGSVYCDRHKCPTAGCSNPTSSRSEKCDRCSAEDILRNAPGLVTITENQGIFLIRKSVQNCDSDAYKECYAMSIIKSDKKVFHLRIVKLINQQNFVVKKPKLVIDTEKTSIDEAVKEIVSDTNSRLGKYIDNTKITSLKESDPKPLISARNIEGLEQGNLDVGGGYKKTTKKHNKNKKSVGKNSKKTRKKHSKKSKTGKNTFKKRHFFKKGVGKKHSKNKKSVAKNGKKTRKKHSK